MVFVDVQDNDTDIKNTSPAEAQKIIDYIKDNRDKRVGIITPFVNQKN